MRRGIVWGLVLLLGLPAGAWAGLLLKVGLAEPEQMPFFWRDGEGEYRGIYPEVLRLIAQEAGFELEFEALSQARLLKHFEMGALHIEPGVSPAWRGEGEGAGDALFSDPFLTVNQVIIYRPELSFPVFILKDLKGLRVASVRGEHAPDYILLDEVGNDLQVAQRVGRGWNDVGLMKEAVALYYQRSLGLNYQISLPYASNPVSFRLHPSRSDWLQPLNRAIARLKSDGRLEALLCRYLCGG